MGRGVKRRRPAERERRRYRFALLPWRVLPGWIGLGRGAARRRRRLLAWRKRLKAGK